MHREPAIHVQQIEREPEPQPGAPAPVFIRYRKRRFQGARLRMLSGDEIEIHVQALTLPPGTSVEVEFLRDGRQWRLPARVARCTEREIGLRLSASLSDSP